MPPAQAAERAGPSGGIAAAGALAVILAATVMAYQGGLNAGYQFDDWNVIAHASNVRSLADWWAAQPGMRPLLKLSWALQLDFGAGPRGLRGVNLAIHLANVALVAVLGQQLLLLRAIALPPGAAAAGRWPTFQAAPWPALWAAGVFALHPVQTESVTYLSGRASALCTLFVLLTITLWLHGRNAGPPGWARRGARAASPLCFALALGCKEMAIVAPLALLLVLRQAEPGLRGRALAGAWLRAALPHLAVAALALALAAALPRYRMLLQTSLDLYGSRFDAGQALLTQAQALAWLAGQASGGCRLNADPALPVVGALQAGPALMLLLLAAGLVRALRTRHPLGFGLLWALLWLAPTNSLLPRLDAANDRQLYLALVGPAWGLACSAQAWAVGGRRRGAAVAFAGLAVLALLGAATAARQRVYASEVTFWRDVVEQSPHNARAQNNLGYALALACDAAGARAAFERALALAPADPQPRLNLAWLASGQLPGLPAACRAASPQAGPPDERPR